MSTIVHDAGSGPRAKKSAYQALFDAPDQGRVRADLATFFGPRAATFLDVYGKMRAAPARRGMVRTWSWPVFLGSFTWFFYRKMYVYGAMMIFLPLIFLYLFGWAGSGGLLLFASEAKGWYVNNALGRISKADELGLTGPERADYLQRAGGVSLPAGIFAGLIYGFCVVVLIFAIVTRHKSGHT